jgi:hypothetical protein
VEFMVEVLYVASLDLGSFVSRIISCALLLRSGRPKNAIREDNETEWLRRDFKI